MIRSVNNLFTPLPLTEQQQARGRRSVPATPLQRPPGSVPGKDGSFRKELWDVKASSWSILRTETKRVFPALVRWVKTSH